MKKKVRLVITSILLIFILLIVWFATIGINKTIEQTLSVDVYEDKDWSYITSSIDISGEFKKTLFSTTFVGTFAIEYCEPTCRDGAEAKIAWGDNYQSINYFYSGDFSRFDIKAIEIDEKMERIVIYLEDGTIIATPNVYIPTHIYKKHKETSFSN